MRIALKSRLTATVLLRAAWLRARRVNLAMLILVAGAIVYGVAFLYAAGQQSGGRFSGMWVRQCLYAGIGSVCMVGVAMLDYRVLARYIWHLFFLTIAGLVLVVLVGDEINGAKSWIDLGPVTVQPSEFGKVGSILLLAFLASRPSLDPSNFWHSVLIGGVAAGIPAALILCQPDVGSALTLVPIALAILFLSGLKLRWLFCLAVIILPFLPYTWKNLAKQHHRDRVWVFAYHLMPAEMRQNHEPPNISREGYNAHQSLLAVGSGGIWGKGYMQGTQNALGFLPRNVAPSDFIFSVIAEESGFVGSVILLTIQWLLIMCCVYVSMVAGNQFGRNIAVGIAALLCAHLYINVGMTIGLAPIIGIPLPFVSRGGSVMLSLLICVGLLQSIYMHRPQHVDKLELTHG